MGIRINFDIILKTEDEDEVIGIKEAVANLIEQWQDVEKPIRIEIVDGKKEQKEIEAMFEDFWREYPRKVDKVNAFKAFKKVCRDRKMLLTLLSALAQHRKTEQWQTKTLIPHASTWLNGRRWEDDLSSLEADKPQTSYDLDSFRDRSLHGELKYVRKGERKNA